MHAEMKKGEGDFLQDNRTVYKILQVTKLTSIKTFRLKLKIIHSYISLPLYLPPSLIT